MKACRLADPVLTDCRVSHAVRPLVRLRCLPSAQELPERLGGATSVIITSNEIPSTLEVWMSVDSTFTTREFHAVVSPSPALREVFSLICTVVVHHRARRVSLWLIYSDADRPIDRWKVAQPGHGKKEPLHEGDAEFPQH